MSVRSSKTNKTFSVEVNCSFGWIYNTDTRSAGYLFLILTPCERDGAKGASPDRSVRPVPVAASRSPDQRSANCRILGAFAKLRKVTISFFMFICVCLSFYPSAWNNSAPTGLVFMEFYVCVFFQNLSRKFKFH
jgi:hypothetical protein